MDFTIRRAMPDDAQALSVLGAATVLETYTGLLPGPDLLAFCAAKHSPAQYAALLNDPGSTVWIAQAPLGAPIGYLVLVPATLPLEGPQLGDYEVLRIYVLHPFHKTGAWPCADGACGQRSAARATRHGLCWACITTTRGRSRFIGGRGSRSSPRGNSWSGQPCAATRCWRARY